MHDSNEWGLKHCEEICEPKYARRSKREGYEVPTPCHDCPNSPPDLLPGNHLADALVSKVIRCRDFNGFMDIRLFLKVVEIEGLDFTYQRELIEYAFLVNEILNEIKVKERSRKEQEKKHGPR